MSAPPEISVIIPVYNCAEYLAEAIESVLAQTFQDFELIVVDDGSTDGTGEVARSYGDRIKYLPQENRGPGAAKNLGIKNSRGSLVATLDADDKWMPHKLERQYEYMKSRPEIGMVNADFSTFNEKGIMTRAYNRAHREIYEGDIFDRLILKNFIGSGVVMIRRKCLEKVGIFPENFMISEDWHLWLRIAKEYPVGYIDEPLGMYRWQEKSLTWDYSRSYPDRLRVLEEITALYPDYFRSRRALLRRAWGGVLMRYGYSLFNAGDYRGAKKQFISSIRRDPFRIKPYLYLSGLFLPKRLKGYITRVKGRMGIRFMPAE